MVIDIRDRIAMYMPSLLKAYPNYEPTDYILWIESSMIMPQWDIMSSKVVLLDDNSDTISSIVAPYIGKPYPNVKYKNCDKWQLRLRCNHKSTFGIPILFHSFDELMRIKHIQIIYETSFYTNNETLCSLLQTNYDVSFAHDKNKRFYTIKNQCVNPIVANRNELSSLYDEFVHSFDNIESYVFKAYSDELKSDKTSNMIKKYALTFPYTCGCDWMICVLSKKLTLVPTAIPDVDIEHTKDVSYKELYYMQTNNDFSKYEKFIDYYMKNNKKG